MDISVRTEGPWTAEDRSWLASRDGTEVTRSITLDTSAFTAGTHYPNGYVPSGMVLAKLANDLYGPYGGNVSEVQTATITGAPTGGTFTLTLEGETTAAIAYNATAAAVQTALEGLSNLAPGDVTVTGAAGGPYTITFGGARAGADVPQMTASGAGLTGGTSPAVGVATTTAGGATVAGAGTAEGFLFSNERMRAGGPDVGAALHWRGVIKVSNLPANSGLDAAARAQLTRFRFE
jgi:hypothetical protein